MQISASLLTGLAVAAAAGGWGLLAGLVLAGVFAAVASSTGMPDHPWLRAAVLLPLGVLAAQAFGAYLVPENSALAAVVVVVLATGAAAADLDVPAAARRLLAVVLVLAAASFAAVCFGIEPPGSASPGEPNGTFGTYAVPGPLGVLAAAGLFAAPLLVMDRGVPRRRVLARVACGVVAAVAVGAGALHQLGPSRLALSDTPLRDTLAAADATPLNTMLAATVALCTLPAALAALSGAVREIEGPRAARVLVIGGVGAAGAAFLPPAATLAAASTVAVTATLLGWLQNRRQNRQQTRQRGVGQDETGARY